jgi:hypothetical protein
MSWKERVLNLAVRAVEEAARERLQQKFQGVNELFEQVKAPAPPPSNPPPPWYAGAVQRPAPALDPTARAIFVARQEELRRVEDRKAEMLMQHMRSMQSSILSLMRPI